MSETLTRQDEPLTIFELAAAGEVDRARRLFDRGVPVDSVDATTGMSPLHYAIGRNRIAFVQFLIKRQAQFFPDKLGRMPSSIASICECGEEMCDVVVEAEIAAQETSSLEAEAAPTLSDADIASMAASLSSVSEDPPSAIRAYLERKKADEGRQKKGSSRDQTPDDEPEAEDESGQPEKGA